MTTAAEWIEATELHLAGLYIYRDLSESLIAWILNEP